MFAFIRLQQVESQTVQELSNALAQIWQEIPQDTITSLGACSGIVRHAYKHFFIFYFLHFSVAFEFSPL